ncbi:MAG: radical SAM protein [Pyrinomonadaceae bacterium]
MEFSTETGDAGSATLMLHLLGRCNLTCLHCYMGGSPSRREQLPLQPVLHAIAECKHLGIGALYLTGGEPLLYRDFEKVLRAAEEVPGLKVTVCTNGTLVKQNHIALLKNANAQVNISIDGEAEFHDRFRNHAGAFKATERGMRNIVEAGIPVTVVSTISQGNLHSLAWLVEWAAQTGAFEFRAQPLLKLGRGTDITDQCLTTQQSNRMLLQLSDHANTYRSRGLRCSVVGVSRRFLLAHPCGAYVCNGAGCHRRVSQEIKKLVVREDGTVLPEITNLSHEFALGKIDDGSLSLMVERYFEDGYARFDQLCRSIYTEVLPNWEPAIVPWDQIVAERSHSWRPRPSTAEAIPGCGDCSVTAASPCSTVEASQ